MSRKTEISAGLLVYRHAGDPAHIPEKWEPVFRKGYAPTHEVLLAHPGGPFWAKKDAGAWTIPKGLVEPGADLLATATREFTEETGFVAQGPFAPLEPVRQKSGKVVHAFACAGDFDPDKLVSNSFEIEWPPRSGKRKRFPEIDRAAWLSLDAAREKILTYQLPFLDQLEALLKL